MTFNLRAHEFGVEKPRIRVWYDNMGAYGQFRVVSYNDIQQFVDLGLKMDIGTFIIHRCDGMEKCDCHTLTHGEQIKDYIE